MKNKINKITKQVGRIGKLVKKITKFRPRVFSRHPSHGILRKQLPLLNVRSVIRLGSTTEVNNKNVIEINSINAIKISSNKRLMKEKFTEAQVTTAPWFVGNTVENVLNEIKKIGIEFPIVAKSLYGSRGNGNTKLDNVEELTAWANGKNFTNYIFEKYLPYKLEYRLHITKDGCFYTCRKALRKDVDKKEKWHRHVDTCVWLLEENENFFKPNSWQDIITHCVNALNAIGADVLSFDVRVQGATDGKGKPRPYQNFALIECNSASSLGNPNGDGPSVCSQKYLDILPKLILQKAELKGK